MHKFILCVLLLFIPTTLFSGEPDKILHKQCIYPAIMLFNNDGGHGSGVVVKSQKTKDGYLNIALTCAHVVKTAGAEFNVMFVSKYKNWSHVGGIGTSKCYTYALNKEDDIAIVLFYTNKKMSTAKISFNEKLYLGNKVYGVGCGLMQSPRIDYGVITGVSVEGGNIRSSMTCIPGDSGGPVYHNYVLIGLKRAIYTIRVRGESHPIFNISLITPMTSLKKWSESKNNELNFVYDKYLDVPKLVEINFKYKVIKQSLDK